MDVRKATGRDDVDYCRFPFSFVNHSMHAHMDVQETLSYFGREVCGQHGRAQHSLNSELVNSLFVMVLLRIWAQCIMNKCSVQIAKLPACVSSTFSS